MKLIYCYIEHFRNIENQDVSLSDEFDCRYRDSKIFIEKREKNPLMDYIYDNGFMSNLRIIVGKTGSGKTNFLQLIGMDWWNRKSTADGDAYLLLYKMHNENDFFVEEVGLGNKTRAYCFTYDFDKHEILKYIPAAYDDHEDTYIINAFDRYAFASCPYDNVRQEQMFDNNQFIPRKITQYGKSSVSMECEFLKEYLSHFSEKSIKRRASFVIGWKNWQNKIQSDLDEKLIKREYWTYKDRAEEQRDKNFRNGQYNKPIEYDKKSTPKSRFIHDLMVDFAIYLRKWAELVEYEFPEKYYPYTGIVYDLGIEDPRELPDGKKMGILKRIDWLCQYIDYHTDEITSNRGLVWQIGSDIRDLFHLLGKMDDKYFTDTEFTIPVMDIDVNGKTVMRDVFERMEQYRPDQIGVFTECLLPYHWSYVSSGEYQYAKIWGVLEEYGVRVKMMTQGQKYSESIQPNLILLLDEPENYMHPEMCRTFIRNLNVLLSKRNPNTELQVLISTHSPFMLSDVMASQVIKMDYDENGKCVISESKKPYYAANIHSIMADGFFLEYTIGEQARIFLEDKFKLLQRLTCMNRNLSSSEKEELTMIRSLIPNIGDALIRHCFCMMLEKFK
jgi:hypothetical protein